MNAKLVLNKEIKLQNVEMDYSWAMRNSTCLAFNKFAILHYFQKCRKLAIGSEDISFPTILHISSADVMHRICYNLHKKFKPEKKLKQVILHVLVDS